MKKRTRRVLKATLWGVLAVIVLAVGGMLIWSQIGVRAAEPGPLAEAQARPDLRVADAPEGIVLSPAEGGSTQGLVFIPGAKVQPKAYVALLSDLVVDEGVTVVITRPWLNLAFFDPRGMDAFTSAAPGMDTWIVGGHSLGGVRACQMADDADALLLFASYCANDLADSDVAVLSLIGSEDGLSTPAEIAAASPLLPPHAEAVEIEGASHASFGDYGAQTGDGTATLDDDEMRAQVTALVGAFAAGLR